MDRDELVCSFVAIVRLIVRVNMTQHRNRNSNSNGGGR